MNSTWDSSPALTATSPSAAETSAAWSLSCRANVMCKERRVAACLSTAPCNAMTDSTLVTVPSKWVSDPAAAASAPLQALSAAKQRASSNSAPRIALTNGSAGRDSVLKCVRGIVAVIPARASWNWLLHTWSGVDAGAAGSSPPPSAGERSPHQSTKKDFVAGRGSANTSAQAPLSSTTQDLMFTNVGAAVRTAARTPRESHDISNSSM